jgi:hypothetical protein
MINFENETQNFQPEIQQEVNRITFFTTKVTLVNNNSKRINIPHIIRNRFFESENVRYYYVLETGDLYADFRPNKDEIVPDKVEYKTVTIRVTGWSYYIPLPSKWFKYCKPVKASFTQLPEKRTVYKIQLYDKV